MGGVNNYQGTVEVCFYGVWGSVCHNSWSQADAVVVCRQLSFSSLGQLLNKLQLNNAPIYYFMIITAGAISHRYAYFGRRSGPIFMTNVVCSGSETHLTNCTHSTFSSNLRSCSHIFDAGVECPGIHITLHELVWLGCC